MVYTEHLRVDDGASTLGLHVHDLLHDFANQEAKKHGEESMVPGAFFNAYRVAHVDEEQGPLWAVSLRYCRNAECMLLNVCRLQILALRVDEVSSGTQTRCLRLQ